MEKSDVMATDSACREHHLATQMQCVRTFAVKMRILVTVLWALLVMMENIVLHTVHVTDRGNVLELEISALEDLVSFL
jgi:hypothetical protein